jgi:hypothetical protein
MKKEPWAKLTILETPKIKDNPAATKNKEEAWERPFKN